PYATATMERHRDHPRPVGLLLADGRVVDESGTVYGALGLTPKAVVVYGDTSTGAALAEAGRGALISWEGKRIRYEHGERSAILLHHLLPTEQEGVPDAPACLRNLVRFRDWWAARGATVGSNATSGLSMLRATLEAPLPLEPRPAPPPIDPVLGGRI